MQWPIRQQDYWATGLLCWTWPLPALRCLWIGAPAALLAWVFLFFLPRARSSAAFLRFSLLYVGRRLLRDDACATAAWVASAWAVRKREASLSHVRLRFLRGRDCACVSSCPATRRRKRSLVASAPAASPLDADRRPAPSLLRSRRSCCATCAKCLRGRAGGWLLLHVRIVCAVTKPTRNSSQGHDATR